MANSKELTEQVMELHKKQTEEMKALEEQREEALKVEKYDEAAVELHNMYDSYIKAGFTEEQAWKLTEIVFTNRHFSKEVHNNGKNPYDERFCNYPGGRIRFPHL